ncbi:MAG: hypothetical protein AVDCRST_MAG78-3498, partial [uncultured Rubrobacteraceae bacterium]
GGADRRPPARGGGPGGGEVGASRPAATRAACGPSTTPPRSLGELVQHGPLRRPAQDARL